MPNTFNHANDTYMSEDMVDMSLMSFDRPEEQQEFTFSEPTGPEPAITIPNGVNYFVNGAYMPNDLANVSLVDFGYPEDQELHLNDRAEPGPAEPVLPRVGLAG